MSKAQKDYTIADMVRLKPAWFMSKQTQLESGAQKLQLLHSMLEHGMQDISNLPFMQVFGTWDISILSAQEFNKTLHEAKNHNPFAGVFAPQVNIIDTIPQSILYKAVLTDKAGIKQNLEVARGNLQAIENEISEYNEEIIDRQNKIHNLGLSIPTYINMIELLEDALNKPESIEKWKLKMLKDIPASWIVVHVTQTYFVCVRRTPVILNAINSSSGMAKTLYMGFYGIELTWDLRVREIFQCADGMTLDRRTNIIHPHVQRGSICWGNVGHRANEASANKDVGAWFMLFDSILGTYNGGNPYVPMQSFERRKNDAWFDFSSDLTSKVWWKRCQGLLISEWRRHGSERFRQATAYKRVRPPRPSKAVPKKPLDQAMAQLNQLSVLPETSAPSYWLNPTQTGNRITIEAPSDWVNLNEPLWRDPQPIPQHNYTIPF